MNIAQRVTDHPASKVAFYCTGHNFTYAELCERANDVRHWLHGLDVQPGDRVAVAAASEFAFAASMLGVLSTGAVLVPTNPLSPLPELKRMLGPLNPRVIIASEMAAPMLGFGDEAPAPVHSFASVGSAGAADPRAELRSAVVDRAADDVATLMMTSGTVGPAKAAKLSHGNLAWAVDAMTHTDRAGLAVDDVVFSGLPTAHIFGLMMALSIMTKGASGVLQGRFEPESSLDLIAEHGATIIGAAPLMWRRWSAVPDPQDRLRTVTRAVSGAAALPLEVFEAVQSRFGVTIHEAYGLTESTALVTTSLGQQVKATSVGSPMPDTDVLILEPDGLPVEPGDTGEIVVRGPGVFQGYWDDAEATDQILTEDGWLWTGDVGVVDADGDLFLVDRLKDLIIVSGFNVYPAEVEEVLREHPDISGAAVVGVPHIERGETVAAYVIGTADADTVMAHAAENLASYKRPTEVHLVDELPMTAAGKLVRRELR